MTSPQSTTYLKFILFQVFMTDSGSLIDPSFPVNLEGLLIKIVLFFNH